MSERFITNLGLNYDPAYICGMSDEELAQEIREATEWEFDFLRDLCWRANIIDEWDEAGDNFETVAYRAAEILGVEI